MVLRAGFHGTVGQPSAQVIDGSLKFDNSAYLKRTPSSAGNRRTWTWSAWYKSSQKTGTNRYLFAAGYSTTPWYGWIHQLADNSEFQVTYDAGVAAGFKTTPRYRDTGWYHVVWSHDSTQSTDTEKTKIYVNGVQVTDFDNTSYPSLNEEGPVNNTVLHELGGKADRDPLLGRLSQVYLIDGQQLGPEYFGFTDPLTNTWRPKKYTGTFTGTNTFYLPLDGNSPIGQDKSGNGNDWTPVNFGGSNSLEKATGALPILNTTPGGTQAGVGVRTDSNSSSLVLALPLVGNKEDVSNQINSGSTTKVVTANGNAAASTTQSNFYGGSFYFDGTDDTLTIPNNTDFNFGSGDYTIEMWVYPTRISGTQENLITRGTSGYSGFIMSVTNFLDSTDGGSSWNVSITYDNPLVANVWQHIAVCRSGDTWTVYINGVANGSATASGTVQSSAETLTIGERTGQTDFQGYINDIRLYKGAAKYTSNFVPASTNPDILPDTPSGVSGGSKLTKPTEGAVTFDGSGDYLSVADNGDFTLSGDYTVECFFNMSATSGNHAIFGLGPFAGGNNTKVLFRYESSGNFNYYIGGDNLRSRPISKNSWYHLAVVRNSNVVKIFLNGTQVGTDISHSATISGDVHVGSGNNGGSEYNTMTGFISNFRLIKDQALYTSDFTPPTAPLTNVTNTKLLCCQSNGSATAYEVSPGTITANGNTSATNFNPFTTDINAVRGQETGYCTWNPLVGTGTLSDGNLKFDGASNWKNTDGTISFSSGKWYYEGTYVGSQYGSAQGNIAAGIGFKKTTAFLPEGANAEPVNSADYRNNTIAFYQNGYFTDFGTGTGTHTSIRSQIAAGDVVGVSIDLDNGSYEFYLNGISITSGTVSYTGELVPWAEAYYANAFVCNFGQKPFKFPPPDGFQPLNAANVRPETVIARPDKYVGVTTYTGTGSSKTLSDYNHKPDFVWIKLTNAAGHHSLFDSVRGATKIIYSNLTNAENTIASSLSAFNDKGFTVVSDNDVNGSSSYDYVAYGWKAGGNKNTFNVDDVGYDTASAAGLDSGTTNPIGASVGTKQGFSIIRYTGNNANRTIAHGLSEPPKFWIYKNLTDSTNWPVNHTIFGSMRYLYLNLTNTQGDNSSTYWGNMPTSDVLYIGADNDTNGDGDDHILYLWHDVPGLQKFGQFTGNSNADGVYVELGFKPAILLIKNNNSTGDWIIWDNERNKFNPVDRQIWPYTTSGTYGAYDQVGSSYPLDFLSNGFKMRTTDADMNDSSRTYIYAAWAEAPSFNLYGEQSNAR